MAVLAATGVDTFDEQSWTGHQREWSHRNTTMCDRTCAGHDVVLRKHRASELESACCITCSGSCGVTKGCNGGNTCSSTNNSGALSHVDSFVDAYEDPAAETTREKQPLQQNICHVSENICHVRNHVAPLSQEPSQNSTQRCRLTRHKSTRDVGGRGVGQVVGRNARPPSPQELPSRFGVRPQSSVSSRVRAHHTSPIRCISCPWTAQSGL